MSFQEYPKRMHHPHNEPAVYEQLPGKGQGLFAPDTVCRKPERLPDVTVTNKAEEQRYAALGYRPTNCPNPGEYEQAILDAQPETEYAFQEFPKWKYHAYEMPRIVNDADEEASLGEEWEDRPVIATEEDVGNDPEVETVEDEIAPVVAAKPKGRGGRPKKSAAVQ